jgi:peptidoglycan/LPS O-acetylase OafA/YrhL
LSVGKTKRFAGKTWLLAALLTISVFVSTGWMMLPVGFSAVVLGSIIVVIHLVNRPKSIFSRTLSHPAATAIGRRSYGLYLYHWPVFLFLGIDRRVHVLVLAFSSTFLVTWLSYRYIERPFLRMKARWTSSPSE